MGKQKRLLGYIISSCSQRGPNTATPGEEILTAFRHSGTHPCRWIKTTEQPLTKTENLRRETLKPEKRGRTVTRRCATLHAARRKHSPSDKGSQCMPGRGEERLAEDSSQSLPGQRRTLSHDSDQKAPDRREAEPSPLALD